MICLLILILSIDFNGRCIISRTGYTGELGYELYVKPAEEAIRIFKELLIKGKKYGVAPIGLAARDTLRLEKGFMLADNEFKGGRNPIEAHLGWFVDWNHEFIGKKALLDFKQNDRYDIITFLACIDDGIPRCGDMVVMEDNQIGVVTSGNFSPCLKKGIALGYVDVTYREIGEEVIIKGRKEIRAKIIKGPFVKKGEC
jgi:aminomethyltransferase